MDSCSKCITGKKEINNLCYNCNDITCPYCEKEKSVNSQLCTICLKFGLEQQPSSIPPLLQNNNKNYNNQKQMNVLLRKTLALANIKSHYIDILLAHEDEYDAAFTTKAYNPNHNYEIYELLGDGIANAFLSWYFIRRFPQLNCSDGVKILARLKINYASKRSFADIAEKMGFWPFIKAIDEQKATDKEKLLEDVFEAFIGVTVKLLDDEFEIGVGYGIVYKLLETIFDDMQVSLEHDDLYDAKTRLKELFDANPQLGTIKYKTTPLKSIVYRIKDDKEIYMGEGEGRLKSDREQNASKRALELLQKEGYVKQQKNLNIICE